MAHKTIKASAGIGNKTKRHDITFVKIVVCHVSCFLSRLWVHLNLPITPFSVKRSKIVSSTQSIKSIRQKSKGKLSILVTALTLLKSTQKRKLPTFFLTRTTGELHGETDSLTIHFGAYPPLGYQSLVYT